VVCLVCSKFFDEFNKFELEFNNCVIICVGCSNFIELFVDFGFWIWLWWCEYESLLRKCCLFSL